MCTSLNDLFSCLRPQVNMESEANEDVVPGGSNTARRNSLKQKQQLKKGKEKEQQQQQRSKGAAPAPPGTSAVVTALTPSRPPAGCIRPTSRDSRVSYEAMERYDQIFGGPAGPESTSTRNIPDQF